jgi:hypothetical protein
MHYIDLELWTRKTDNDVAGVIAFRNLLLGENAITAQP